MLVRNEILLTSIFFAPSHHTGVFLRERERMTRGYYLCSRKEEVVQILIMEYIMTLSRGRLREVSPYKTEREKVFICE